jgi:hypothetical protein
MEIAQITLIIHEVPILHIEKLIIRESFVWLRQNRCSTSY